MCLICLCRCIWIRLLWLYRRYNHTTIDMQQLVAYTVARWHMQFNQLTLVDSPNPDSRCCLKSQAAAEEVGAACSCTQLGGSVQDQATPLCAAVV